MVSDILVELGQVKLLLSAFRVKVHCFAVFQTGCISDIESLSED